MKKFFLHLFVPLLLIQPVHLSAQMDHDAENYIQAYLCVAEPTDWRDDFLGVNGHAFIRFVCDTFDVDYCYSYENEGVNGQMMRYLQGDLKMGMFAIPTEEYIVDYQKWHRAVHQYRLNFPQQVEIHLWKIMENKVDDGDRLTLDLNRRGCASSAVRFIMRALGDIPIVYPQNLPYTNRTSIDIAYQKMANYPWMRLVFSLLSGVSYDIHQPIEQKLIIPRDVVEVWLQSTVLGKPMIEYDSELVEAPVVEVQAPLLTPIRVAWIILLITLGLVVWNKSKVWTWILLGFQALMGLLLIGLTLLTQLCSPSAGWLMILLTPIPLILWRWRRYWQIPYASVLLLGVLFIAFGPHMMIDPTFAVLALSYIVIFIQEPVRNYIHLRWAKG